MTGSGIDSGTVARRSRTAVLAALVAAAVVAAGCTATSGASGASGAVDDRQGAAAAAYDPGLWPQRPVVDLAVDVAPDLSRVGGRQSVLFTPDLPVCETVFRAWPNNPTMSATGASLTVTGAAVDGQPVVPRVFPAGAGDGAPGTLVELPLARCLPAGGAVRVDLAFTLALGARADERVGFDPETRTAWFGSGFPMLAWERGRGWARDPAVAMNGETATSEDVALSLAVTAPSDLAVTGTGSAAGTAPSGPGRTVHRFTAPAVRDATVGVGAYDVREQDVQGVRVHLATPRSGTRAEPERWMQEVERTLRALPPVFGPYPYPDLWITLTPSQSDGTEFPTALQFGDVDADTLPGLVAHEIAHEWFYGLVGNNQAEDPWLDESFATFGETVVGTDTYDLDDVPDDAVGRMSEPMSSWADDGGFDAYTRAVYNQGAAVLAEARERIGPERFDPLLRAYVQANAHRVAMPADVARAFAGEPEVIGLLVGAGALPGP